MPASRARKSFGNGFLTNFLFYAFMPPLPSDEGPAVHTGSRKAEGRRSRGGRTVASDSGGRPMQGFS